jgi:hypothetical protein
VSVSTDRPFDEIVQAYEAALRWRIYWLLVGGGGAVPGELGALIASGPGEFARRDPVALDKSFVQREQLRQGAACVGDGSGGSRHLQAREPIIRIVVLIAGQLPPKT